MKFTESEIKELAKYVASYVIEALESANLKAWSGQTNTIGNVNPKLTPLNTYQKTERLLYNYNAFKKIIADKQFEIERIKRVGVQHKSKSVTTHSGNVPFDVGIVLEEDTVDSVVDSILCSISETQNALALIDKALESVKYDPYYDVIPKLYFDGLSQEDVASEYGCSQVNISKNKNRLIKALAIQLFPDQFVHELLT